MECTEIGLKILALCECHLIKSRAQFWKDFNDIELIEQAVLSDKAIGVKIEELSRQFENIEDIPYGMICAFDEDFPQINSNANDGDKPFLLFCVGDKELLQDLNQNVAVIGVTNPTNEIEARERLIVKKLIDSGMTIVSGLAIGCDTIAHTVCVENNAKTIAILPSTLSKIYPAVNRELAERIVEQGGLLISEYFNEPSSRYDATARFIERDRLQALFSKTVIMIASYLKGKGDSGSRHAMGYAKNYGIDRYVMYNLKTDKNDERLALNKEYVEKENVSILAHESIDIISGKKNKKLVKQSDMTCTQLKLF